MRFLTAPLAFAACVGLGWLIYQDSLDQGEHRRPERQAEPIAVQVTRVQTRLIEDRIDLVGSLEPVRQVEIRSRTSGYITRLPFDIGDTVTSGKVVVELDDSKHRELVTNSQAALKVALAQLESKKAKQDLARRENARLIDLAKSGVVTKQEQEQTAAQHAIATAEVELEKARVNQAESDVLQSKLALNELQIVAPLSGVVAERFVERGDLAQPDNPLLRIVDLTKVRTFVNVVEKDYQKVKVGQSATIQVDAFPGKSFSGKIVRKAPILDPATRTAAVQIEIQNPESFLKPGMHARVRIVFEKREQADVVPVASLIEHNDKSAIFVVDGDPPTTQLHEVETGISDGESVEIIKGIDSNDRVVTLGSRLVEHGQTVIPVETFGPTATARGKLDGVHSTTGE